MHTILGDQSKPSFTVEDLPPHLRALDSLTKRSGQSWADVCHMTINDAILLQSDGDTAEYSSSDSVRPLFLSSQLPVWFGKGGGIFLSDSMAITGHACSNCTENGE